MTMSYRLRQAMIPVLPQGHRPIRVLHFSDLHLTPTRTEEIADIKSWINLKPDLVVSTGDFLAHPDVVPTVLHALDQLLELPGVFVFGSNDYYAPRFKNPFSYLQRDSGKRVLGPDLPTEDLRKGLTGRGWKELNDQRHELTVMDTHIEFRGTDDGHLDRDHYERVAGAAMNCDLAIGVTHAPYARILEAMGNDHVDMIFAGHTHGGQVRLPWPGGSKALTTNCDLPNWRARGVSKLANEPWLNVSAGMGTSPFARIRVASPPEVSLITLESSL